MGSSWQFKPNPNFKNEVMERTKEKIQEAVGPNTHVELLHKAYVTDVRDMLGVGGRSTPVEVFFTFNAEHATFWFTREQARDACRTFDAYKIHVSWAEGGDYVCKDFKVEECGPRQFAVFCAGPFALK